MGKQHRQDLSTAAIQLGPLPLDPSGDGGEWARIVTDDEAEITKGAEGMTDRMPVVRYGVLTINAQAGFPMAKALMNLVLQRRVNPIEVPLAGAGISSAGEPIAWKRAIPTSIPDWVATGGAGELQQFVFALEGVARAPLV